MAPKTSLRDKLDEDTLDLSLMQLEEVPVQEIAELPKGTVLDLSNNHLRTLPDTFPTLTHIIRLDLGKNHLTELPEYFGQLRNLRHLDLYSNELTHLPVSFAQLKNLKWLDLKNNPLVPALQQAAGPCITTSDCALCAKKVVALLQSMQSQLERERQKLMLEEQKAAAARRAIEEQERERLRAEKRAAKERRREEARAKELMAKSGGKNGAAGDGAGIDEDLMHEMEKPRDGKSGGRGVGNGVASGSDSGKKRGWCWSLLMFLLGMFFVSVAAGISLLWIYTGGHLDQRSIERALPVIRKDVDATFLTMGRKADGFYQESSKTLGPYVKQAQDQGVVAAKEAKRLWHELAVWTDKNLGPYMCCAKSSVKRWLASAQEYLQEGWAWLKPRIWEWWLWARPHFQRLGEAIIEQCRLAYAWAEQNLPVYYAWAADTAVEYYGRAREAVQGMING